MYALYMLYTIKYRVLSLSIVYEYTLLSSTMRINYETKRELVKIGAELSIKDGIERSMEDVVKYLIEAYKKENKAKK